MVRVLVVLQPDASARRLERLLVAPGVLVATLPQTANLWQLLSHEPQDVVITNAAAFPHQLAATVATIRSLPERIEVVVLCCHEDGEARARLLAAGCLGLVHEELPDEALGAALEALFGRCRNELDRRIDQNRNGHPYLLSDFISASPVMDPLLRTARRVINADSSLLVTGETGVGKDHLARAIHNEGPRRAAPFVAVNCAALPESLLESELFGHVAGAFTGAHRAHRGLFELAHRGTIFLDEIAEMPLSTQAKLLRVLQDRLIRPVGGERDLSVDVRVIAATNRDLDAELAARRFRPDLYYRLSVVTLHIPPLRERREDIPVLVDRYLQQFRRRFGHPLTTVRRDAMDILRAYCWPGNLRELVNVVERAVLLCADSEVTPSDLTFAVAPVAGDQPPAELQDQEWPRGLGPPAASRPILPWAEARRQALDHFEQQYFAALLASCGGRIGMAARRAGISPRALFDKLRRHGLRKESYRLSE
ncbi:MAG: sigma-54-dependent Fis family transcriptional regulator [Candidatus Schekmanbacteria bacterium]|nr:sigma-54-dependent Fis family transcriptional regulator [Candidatus Schekmanbacteria bacterium]